MIDCELVDKGVFEPELETQLRNCHPWRRFFARMIDYQISGLIFTALILSTRLAPDFIINPLQVQNTLQLSSSLAMGFFSMALWVVLEPLMLSQFNNTPGKALLCLKLVRNDVHSSYWRRSFSVWAVGLGFGIPLISTFATIIAATRLKQRGITDGCAEVKVSGREGLVKVITSDSVNDLALLQLPGHIDSFAKLNPDTRKLRQGEDIIVFGYPLNFALSSGGNLTLGILSALTGLGNNTNQIQITAPIQPGSSGSPVMDKKANVVGVVSMKLDDGKMTKLTGQIAQNVNFAANGLTVKAFLDANKVPYKTGGGFFSTEKNNADIADEARKWTVLVECWK